MHLGRICALPFAMVTVRVGFRNFSVYALVCCVKKPESSDSLPRLCTDNSEGYHKIVLKSSEFPSMRMLFSIADDAPRTHATSRLRVIMPNNTIMVCEYRKCARHDTLLSSAHRCEASKSTIDANDHSSIM